jgi:hypothetical protein
MTRVVGAYRRRDDATCDHVCDTVKRMKRAGVTLMPHDLAPLTSDQYPSAKSPAGKVVATPTAYFPSHNATQRTIAALGAKRRHDVPNYVDLTPDARLAQVIENKGAF